MSKLKNAALFVAHHVWWFLMLVVGGIAWSFGKRNPVVISETGSFSDHREELRERVRVQAEIDAYNAIKNAGFPQSQIDAVEQRLRDKKILK